MQKIAINISKVLSEDQIDITTEFVVKNDVYIYIKIHYKIITRHLLRRCFVIFFRRQQLKKEFLCQGILIIAGGCFSQPGLRGRGDF